MSVAVVSVGGEYQDATGRRLKVAAIEPNAKDGREVVGMVCRELGHNTYSTWMPYATSFAIWTAVWRDKVPAWKGTV